MELSSRICPTLRTLVISKGRGVEVRRIARGRLVDTEDMTPTNSDLNPEFNVQREENRLWRRMSPEECSDGNDHPLEREIVHRRYPDFFAVESEARHSQTL
ncbi:hypothetical protein QAD02_021594 [Eretmocerus hayati]|uniref:Uncharacterized protein n=1 Tax=Eretmocerus hayati TaxID=131215 RepID=A0ACC2PS57_9HYME|nr:hypothetical protein QAD02_021594 [Eretmocerus hayati]